jgi:heat shock protein HslJ
MSGNGSHSLAPGVVRYPYAFPSFDRNDAMLITSAARRIACFPLLRERRTARMRFVAALLVAAALSAACALPKHNDADAPPPDPFNPAATQLLDNTSWQLTGWTRADGAMRDVPHGDETGKTDDASGAPITLILSTATGQRRASGFSGCNRYTGTYMLRNGKLSFGLLASTRMACAGTGGELESAYLDALAHIDRTGVQMRPPQQLQLITATGDTLVFARTDK